MTREFPPFLRELLASVPEPGQGHAWLYKVARQLHAHLPALEIVTLLETSAANHGQRFTHREIVEAVQNSVAAAWQPNGRPRPMQAASKWPCVDQARRTAIIRDGGALARLWEASPVRLADNEAHTEEIIDRLFPGNSLLCCGKSNSVFDTRPREAWRGKLAAMQLLVPSPMSAIEGVTKEGKPSRHTLSNTGPRKFLICEFDTGAIDEHAALLLHLAAFAPMVCAVHSGRKSLHGWFLVHAQPDAKVEKFFRYAVNLGADPSTWTRSQFVRMPDGTRDNGNRQTVFFLNFKPLEAPAKR